MFYMKVMLCQQYTVATIAQYIFLKYQQLLMQYILHLEN